MDTKATKRAAIYARVSTTDQSAQMQLDVLREYAQRRNLDIVDEFVDHGISGAKEKRPQLDQLMDGARKRLFDIVLVYRFDRFARSVKHLVTALEEFSNLGIEFLSYSENLDTSTPMGRAMFSIIGALAELERNLIVERSKEGQKRARARGIHVGRPRKAVNSEEVLYLRQQGLSLRAIGRKVGVSTTIVSRVLKEVG